MINKLPRCTALLEEGIARGLHIGAQVCVSSGGELVADFAVGSARDGCELRPDHRVLWMSAGKPLTAIAIAQQRDRGLLSFDEPVANFIPDFARHGKESILVRHLLTHTHAYQPPALDWPRMAWEEIISQICNARIPGNRVPGEYAAYDPQTTWYLLAEILQRLTAKPFYEYVQREVLQRAGCNDSSIGLPAGEYQKLLEADKLALLHDTTQAAREETDLRAQSAPVWQGDNEQRSIAHNPGGGALGTARDLCRFYQVLDATWNGDESPDMIATSTLRAMTSRVREGLVDHAFRQRIDWGLGFLINSGRYGGDATPYGYGSHASESTFGHGGVQSTSAWCDPERRLCVAVIFNGLPGEPKHSKRISEFNTALYEELQLIN